VLFVLIATIIESINDIWYLIWLVGAIGVAMIFILGLYLIFNSYQNKSHEER